MILVLCLALEFMMLINLVVRVRNLCAPLLVIAYCAMSQILYYNADLFGYPQISGPESLGSYYYLRNEGVAVYFLISLLSFMSSWGIKAQHLDIRARIGEIIVHSKIITGRLSVAVICANLIVWALIDYPDFWYHTAYSTSGLILHDGVFGILEKMRPIFAFLSIALFHFSITNRQMVRSFILSIFSALYIALALSGSSRVAVVLIVSSGFFSFIAYRRSGLLLLILHLIVAYASLVAVIYGRGGQEFGLYAIPGFFIDGLTSRNGSNLLALYNLFQGINVTMDGFALAPNYDPKYALFSLSPLPSSIDGFDVLLQRYEVRLGLFVPVGGITEAYYFGWPIFLTVVAVIMAASRVTVRAAAKGRVIWSALSTLIFFAMFVMLGAYPLRNSFRQFLMIVMIDVALRIWTGKRRQPLDRIPRRTVSGARTPR